MTPAAAPARRVLALGGWLKNTAALVERTADGRVRLLRSPLHGDLGTPEACIALAASASALRARAGGRIDAVAHDLHPDFPSTRLAVSLAAELGVPAVAVQHHHAHAAVVPALAAVDRPGSVPAGPSIAVTLDGVGLGTDGTAWGGEVLVVDGGRSRRVAHLAPLPMPGGDRAATEPWRMAAAALHACDRPDRIVPTVSPWAGAALADGVRRLLATGTRCPTTTAAGRWFDAAAGLLGLHARHQQEAEAAVALERLAAEAGDLDAALAGEPPRWRALPGDGSGAPTVADLRPTLARIAMLAGLLDGTEAGDAGEAARRTAAALFHRDLADGLVAATVAAAQARRTRTVLLAGGCLHNRVLRERLVARLTDAGLGPHLPPPADRGDAGLAVGQAWVALCRLDTEPEADPAAADDEGADADDADVRVHVHADTADTDAGARRPTPLRYPPATPRPHGRVAPAAGSPPCASPSLP